MEHSERARYATDQVKLWVANDSDHAFKAAAFARNGDLDGLAAYLTKAIQGAQPHSAPWQVAQELAPNDWARIQWQDVADELTTE